MNVRFKFAASTVVLASAALVATAQQNNDDQGGPPPEIIQHKTNSREDAAPNPGSTGLVSPPTTYHNGALIGTPGIYIIWYGNWNQTNGSDTSQGQNIVRDFAHNLGGSNYFRINTSYSTSRYPITGAVAFGGETTDAYSQGRRLRDSSVLTIVNNAIASGRLIYDPNGLYFVLTSSDVSESSGFCTQYCGWHTAGRANSGHVRYAFVGNANRCLNACAAQTVGPNGNAGVDGMISVMAHEIEEATTDPDPSSGWVDANGAENGDKCAWTFGQSLFIPSTGAYYNITLGSRNYLIQRNLKHSTSGDTCDMQ